MKLCISIKDVTIQRMMRNKGLMYGMVLSLIVFTIFSIVSNSCGKVRLDKVLISWAEAVWSVMEAISMIASLEALLGVTVVLSMKKDRLNGFSLIYC